MNILSPQEIVEVIAQARVAHIGVLLDGEPYVTPISFVPIGNGVAFRSLTGARMDAIAAHPRVSVEMTVQNADTGSWRSVVASGVATLIEDTNQEAEIIQQLLKRYSEAFDSLFGDTGPALSRAYVIRVEFDGVTGRSSGTYLQPKTRPGRL